MKTVFVYPVVLVCAGIIVSFAVHGAELARDGRTEYVISVSPDASQTDRFAAEEMQTFLGQSTGARFEIVADGARRAKSIEIGTPKARELIGGAMMDALDEEESVYVVRGDAVAIAGKGVAGNAYGVYSFLEREIGCRWFTLMGDNLVPKRPVLDIGDRMEKEKPELPYRGFATAMCQHNNRDSSDVLFLFRNRCNWNTLNYTNVCSERLRGKLVPRMWVSLPHCHSTFTYMPPEKYFKDHPEWYCLWTDGKRIPKQLCFSNAEMRRELTKNFIAAVKARGAHGFFDLSHQDDIDNPLCYCDGCAALVKRYGASGAALFDYLHELSPVLKRECPNATVHFLAYHLKATQHPPVGMAPFEDNVVAIFAPLDDDFSKNIAHPNNRRTLEDIRQWSQLLDVWFWSYPIVYTAGNPPFGGIGRAADDYRLAFEAGLKGSYCEHDVGIGCGAGFFDMQAWILTQTFRNTKADWRALRREFADFYYGAAADGIVEYEEFLEKGRERMPAKLGFLGETSELFTGESLVHWQRRFDEMERKVGAPHLQRLREARLPLDALTLKMWRKVVDAGNAGFTVEDVHARVVESYCVGVERRNNRPDAYGAQRRKALLDGPFLRLMEVRRLLATTDVKPLPKMFDGIPANRIVQMFPGLGHAFIDRVALPDAATGFALVEKSVSPDDARFPLSAGMWDRPNGTYPLRTVIAEKDVVPGKFHFYKLGRAPVTSSQCNVWVGKSKWLSIYCPECYVPGSDETWEFYVSLKFDSGRVYMDRVVAVGPDPR